MPSWRWLQRRLAILSASLGRQDKQNRKYALMFIDSMSMTMTEIDAALANEDLATLGADIAEQIDKALS